MDLQTVLATDTDDVLLRAYWKSEVDLFFSSHGFEIHGIYGFDEVEGFFHLDGEEKKSKTTLLVLARKMNK